MLHTFEICRKAVDAQCGDPPEEDHWNGEAGRVAAGRATTTTTGDTVIGKSLTRFAIRASSLHGCDRFVRGEGGALMACVELRARPKRRTGQAKDIAQRAVCCMLASAALAGFEHCVSSDCTRLSLEEVWSATNTFLLAILTDPNGAFLQKE